MPGCYKINKDVIINSIEECTLFNYSFSLCFTLQNSDFESIENDKEVLNYWVQSCLNESTCIATYDTESYDIASELCNNLITMPDAIDTALLCNVLFSKASRILKNTKLLSVAVIDNSNGDGFEVNEELLHELPSCEDYMYTVDDDLFFTLPWWKRNDATTADYAKSEFPDNSLEEVYPEKDSLQDLDNVFSFTEEDLEDDDQLAEVISVCPKPTLVK